MEIVGVFDQIIQDRKNFIIEVQFFSDRAIVANQFVLLVYLILPSDVFLGERPFDGVDKIIEVHIEVPMFLKIMELRMEESVDILTVSLLIGLFCRFVED